LQALRMTDVSISLPARSVVSAFSATVLPGDILTVMGASGSGKSTLLAFISGFLSAPFAATGEVLLGDRRLNALPPHERRVGILFQDDLLFPHLSVASNLMFGLPASVSGRRQRLRTIEQALADADLAGFAQRDPATLSGGQRARVALLRTLLSQPRALLLDEPFSKLDAALRDDFRRFVFDFARRANLPTVLVTHDAADAAATGGRIVSLDSTPGITSPRQP
jgi:putative thiamine transport system ATP-binding protein